MKTDGYLDLLGFSRTHKGFAYTVDAIDAFRSGYCGNMMNLYADIGMRHLANRNRVERCIRHSISCAMDRNPYFFRDLMLPESRWECGITNGEFLRVAAARLAKLEEDEKYWG